MILTEEEDEFWRKAYLGYLGIQKHHGEEPSNHGINDSCNGFADDALKDYQEMKRKSGD